QSEFFADESVELVRASGILGENADAFAVPRFTRIQRLSRLEILLGFTEPIHFQAEQSELIERFAEFRVELRRLSQMLDGAFLLSGFVINRAQQKMHWRARFQLQRGGKMFKSLLAIAGDDEQGA